MKVMKATNLWFSTQLTCRSDFLSRPTDADRILDVDPVSLGRLNLSPAAPGWSGLGEGRLAGLQGSAVDTSRGKFKRIVLAFSSWTKRCTLVSSSSGSTFVTFFLISARSSLVAIAVFLTFFSTILTSEFLSYLVISLCKKKFRMKLDKSRTYCTLYAGVSYVG